MDGRAGPDDEQLAANLAQELAEEGDDRRPEEGLILDMGKQPSVRGNRTDRREVVTRERGAQDGVWSTGE